MDLTVSARLAARVRRDFAPDASEAVLARLAKFEHAVGRAERDWRDVLVWSGLGNNWYPVLDAELGPA